MNITFICHYFPPEIGAPSARIFEMAREWVRLGHHVEVVTCFPNHPTGIIPDKYKGMRYSKEDMEGIVVHRNYVYATPNKGFIKKTMGHISFMVSSVFLTLKKISNTDVIITSSPTFFSIFSGLIFSKVKKVPFILEIRDLWPAAIVELGVLKNKLIISILEKIELYFYKKCDRLIMVTESFKKIAIMRGIRPEKIEVITNGYSEEIFDGAPKDEEIIDRYNLKGKFVVEYVGAHGISQGLDKILLVAEQLKKFMDISFVFVGEGAEKKNLIDFAIKNNLENVQFIDAQSKDMIPRFYNTADVCIIPLKDIKLFKTFIPSKMFEIMGCGRPIIASVAGEAADILEKSGAAIVVLPEDVIAIKDSILKLKNNKELSDIMGIRGQVFAKQNYSRCMLARRYLDIINNVVKTSMN